MTQKTGFYEWLCRAQIYCVTLFGGQEVGRDDLGNRYYKSRKSHSGRERRWVIYKGAAEASAVPPEWHGWLHHQVKDIPEQSTALWRRPWQKPPAANKTGTAEAYLPPGHTLKGGKRAEATGDYEAWSPPQ